MECRHVGHDEQSRNDATDPENDETAPPDDAAGSADNAESRNDAKDDEPVWRHERHVSLHTNFSIVYI